MNSKKSKIYRRNARKKAIKILNKKRKSRPVVQRDDVEDNFSDAETIQYAEPYRDTSKKDEIYRRKPKKKAIKILTNKTRKEISDDQQDNFSDAESIQYAELYRDSSKKKRNIQKKS